ncbi:Bug family tripartite tricarboxylate transporter substrate binding protein [Massilia niastensis]|uniref:Bug family tripartite tricarboxylate transporter substrate binding protein n=1 Tax=Massilia niastensis TaxID=544911 RepID=UPI0003808CB8|nr:tripartite tricarboxylate transporter substrate binding protein [Massilia niastensis]
MDAVARILASRLTENLGQQFIVDNRPGANGTLGSSLASKSDPDGYTLLVQASTFVAAPLLMKKVPYDIHNDFTPITQLGAVPLLVSSSPGIPAKNLQEFIAAIKATPGKYTFGTSAEGSASHLAEVAIRRDAKLDFMIVPYKGTAPALTDVMGGHTSAMVDALPSTLPHVKSGKLKPLAVTSAQRIPSLPDVPTVAESGLEGFEMVSWYGLWGPAKMPAELVAKIHQEVAKALNSQQVARSLGAQGFIVSGAAPEQFKSYIKLESDKYGRIISAAKIELDK